MKYSSGAFLAAALFVTSLFVVATQPAEASPLAQLNKRELALSDMPAGWRAIGAGHRGSNAAGGCLQPFAAPKGVDRSTVTYGQTGGPSVQEVLAHGPNIEHVYKAAVARYSGCTSVRVTQQGTLFTGHGITMPFAPVGNRSAAFAFRLAAGQRPLGVDAVVFRDGRYVGAVSLRANGLPDPVQLQVFVAKAVNRLSTGAGGDTTSTMSPGSPLASRASP